MSSTRSYSLFELLSSVQRCLATNYSKRYWLRSETSDFRTSPSSGHAFLELVERDECASNRIKAKVRATIWSSALRNILSKFKSVGLEGLTSGMSILAEVELNFHPEYGLSLVIHDIDPNYLLGDLARQRQETINRLKKEGLLDANKTYELARPLQRIAIISSPSAAGYGDFVRHLRGKSFSLVCYTALFSAVMQGEQTTNSINDALGRIHESLELFDAVVIIRGGGSVSDLKAFDDYELCMICANFPLPIITGIGHERDQSVLDLVAHTSCKTPTAVADFIRDVQQKESDYVEDLKLRLQKAYMNLSVNRHYELKMLKLRFPNLIRSSLKSLHYEQMKLKHRLGRTAQMKLRYYLHDVERYQERIPLLASRQVGTCRSDLLHLKQRLNTPLHNHQQRYRSQLAYLMQSIRLSDPEQVLKRGFALLEYKGEVLSKDEDLVRLSSGEKMEVVLRRYKLQVEVKEVCPK